MVSKASDLFDQEGSVHRRGPDLYAGIADDDYDARRVQMAGEVFPVAIVLQPGESFRDAMYRATGENGFIRTRVAVRLARPSSFKSLSAFKSIAETGEISRVVDVLGIRRDAEQLQSILASRQVRSRQYISFFGHHLKRSQFSGGRRVSPRALKVSEHHRALWSIRWLSFDPETMERLIDDCPVCHTKLGWQMTRGVCFCDRCSHPKVDLRDYPQPLIESNDPEAIRFVVEIVDPIISDASFFSRWSNAYPAKTRAELFEFVVQLSMECQRHEERRRGIVTSISPHNLERAGRALLDWPAGLINLVDSHSPLRNDTRTLNYLQSDASLSPSVRSNIRSLLDVRVRKMALASTQEMENAVAVAKSGACDLRLRNARTSMMELVKRPGQISCMTEAAVRVVRDIASVRLMSRQLGVSVPDVVDLYLSGLLVSLHPEMSAIGVEPEYKAHEIDLPSWLETTKPVPWQPNEIKLSAAKFAMDPHHRVSWPILLRCVLNGEVCVKRGPVSGQGLLHDLYVANPGDLRKLCEFPNVDNRFADVTISTEEVALVLGKSRIMAGQLSRHFQWNSAATVRKLAGLRSLYAFSFELADLCLIEGGELPRVFPVLEREGVARLQVEKLSLWERSAALSSLGLSPAFR